MREYLLVLLIAAGTTYLLAGLCRRIAVRMGALAKVRTRDVHTEPIPYFGGVAMFGGLAVALLVATNMPFLGRFATVAHDASAVVWASLIICAIGVLDDMYDMPAIVKLGGQVLAAGVAVLGGVRFFWIPLPNGGLFSPDDITAIAVTVIVIVVCVNAVNFVDGLDGLAAGLIAIGGTAFFGYTYLLTQDTNPTDYSDLASLATVALVGACLGFLPHNFNPARLFMGDAGSLLLGLLLAAATISMVGNIDPSAQVSRNAEVALYLPIVLPLAIMSIPLLDMTLAVVRRTRRGQRPWHPDTQHLQHRMLAIGHTHRRAVLLLYLWAGIVAFGVTSFAFVEGFLPVVAIAAATLLALVLTAALPNWLRRRA